MCVCEAMSQETMDFFLWALSKSSELSLSGKIQTELHFSATLDDGDEGHGDDGDGNDSTYGILTMFCHAKRALQI